MHNKQSLVLLFFSIAQVVLFSIIGVLSIKASGFSDPLLLIICGALMAHGVWDVVAFFREEGSSESEKTIKDSNSSGATGDSSIPPAIP